MTTNRNHVQLTAIDGDRSAVERELVHIGCVGTTAELRAALDRYAYRAPLRLVSGPDDAHARPEPDPG